MLVIVICVLLISVPAASSLFLCSLLAIWLAMGRTQIFCRMPLFLLGTLPLGLVLCLAAADPGACQAYVFGAFLIAASLPRTHILLQLPMFVFGASYILSVPYQLDTHSLDSSTIVRVTLAISFVACVLIPLRWRGFRFVNLLEGVSGLELERGTGRDLDQWIAYLDGEGGSELNHAEIMALLREYGLPFDRQKPITVAYEKALGRRSIGRSHDRRHEVIIEQRNAGLVDWLTRSREQQFSIWQLMLATFCVASLLGFARNFAWSAPTAIDLKYGVPITLGVAITTFAALWACLAIHHARMKLKAAWLIAVIVSVGVPQLMGFRTVSSPLIQVFIWTMLGHGALLIGLLSHARYRGYRLVRVQPKDQPQLAAAASPNELPASTHTQPVDAQL